MSLVEAEELANHEPAFAAVLPAGGSVETPDWFAREIAAAARRAEPSLAADQRG